MRTLIIAIAALAFLAAPAMALPVLTKDVDVKLSIAAYATIRIMPTELVIAADNLIGGDLIYTGHIWGDIVTNTTPVVTFDILEVGGAVGAWAIIEEILEQVGTSAVWTLGAAVEVTLPDVGVGPILTATKQATVTFTITSPV